MAFSFSISQGHLNLLETCPPQFQKVYLEKLIIPTTAFQEEKIQWGNLFHLFMQQINLGLPQDSLLIENQELRNSIEALIAETSDIWYSKEILSRDAEHYRSLNYQNYLLTVVYDLLVLYRNKATIFDWKTYLQPQKVEKLAKNWQTKLYLYVLTETSGYKPEDISMTYWFVKLPHKPQSLTFNYSCQKHQETKEELNKIFKKLNVYLDDYYGQNKNFPHRPKCEENCPYYRQFLDLETQNKKSFNISSLINIEHVQATKNITPIIDN